MEEEKNLVRSLTLFDGITIVIGSMIGSGVFIAPSLMAGYIASPGLIVLLWIIAGILTVFGAISYGELAASMPKSGGLYVFLREIYSPFWGFISGWTIFLVIQTGFIAAVAVAFAKYMGVFIPWISENNILFLLPLGLKFTSAQLIGIISIIVLTLINIYGLKSGAFVQNLFTVLKTICILFLVISSFIIFKGGFSHYVPLFSPILPSTVTIGLFAAIAVATSKALFSYDAWATVTFVSEEIKEPHKNLPLSLLFGTLVTMIVYVSATLAYIYVLPIPEMAVVKDNRVAAEVAGIIFGNPGLFFISASIMISTFGCNNGLVLGGARVLYAMAKDKLFLVQAAEVNPVTRTPVNALIYQAIWASVLTMTNSYSGLLTYTAFASLLFNSMAIIGIFIMRKRKPHMERPYKVWGYPVVPILYLLIAIFFMIFIIQGDPKNSGTGLCIILLGAPVYYFMEWRNNMLLKKENKEI